ncbi:MAG: PDZ domain-containing protein [Woeseiaceae bacterium]
MTKSTTAIAVSLAASVAAAAIVLNTSEPEAEIDDTPVPVSHFDDSAATEERIRALEAAVSEERQARQLLEDELLVLFGEIERLEANRAQSNDNREAQGRADSESVARFRQFRGERSTTGRRDAMVEAGLAPDRADWILQRESEMRYESLQARFEARNSDEPQDPFDPRLNPEAMLRAEIGDTEYEMYLEANGRPTSVGVSNVMASSPGARAGLQSGDEIVGYDGQRIFSSSELIQRTMSGGEGNVVVDVVRDGAPMQIVLPRGPIGVEIGRLRGR